MEGDVKVVASLQTQVPLCVIVDLKAHLLYFYYYFAKANNLSRGKTA